MWYLIYHVSFCALIMADKPPSACRHAVLSDTLYISGAYTIKRYDESLSLENEGVSSLHSDAWTSRLYPCFAQLSLGYCNWWYRGGLANYLLDLLGRSLTILFLGFVNVVFEITTNFSSSAATLFKKGDENNEWDGQ